MTRDTDLVWNHEHQIFTRLPDHEEAERRNADDFLGSLNKKLKGPTS